METPVTVKSLLDSGKEFVSSDGEETCDAISASGSASVGSSSLLEESARNEFMSMEAIEEGATKSAEGREEQDLKDWETSWTHAVNHMQERSNMHGRSRQMAGIDGFVPRNTTCEVTVEEAGEAEDEAESEMVPVLRWDDETGKWVRDYIDVPVSQHEEDSNADTGLSDLARDDYSKREGARHFQELLNRCFSKAQAQQPKSMRAEAKSFTPATLLQDIALGRRNASIAVKEITSLRGDAPSFRPMGLATMKPTHAANASNSSSYSGRGRFHQQRTRLSSRAAAFVPVHIQWDSEDWSY